MKKVAEPAEKLKPAVRKENGWLKFLRVIIYAVAVVGAAVGVGLLKSAAMSSAYADGSHEAKLANGLAFFVPSLVLLTGNILWGMLRWFLRYSREQWKAGRIIGKLIGGGIWRTLVFVPLFIVPLLVLTPVVTNAISENLANTVGTDTFDLHTVDQRLEYIDNNFDTYIESMSPEDFVNEFEELAMFNMDFAAETESGGATSFLPFTENASAVTKNVALLRKAKLSSKGNFVVFYTTSGDDAITDDRAVELGEMLENIIMRYKNNLGFEYEYKQYLVGASKLANMMVVLGASNIDTNILATAMPVYVANPFTTGSNVLANYAGRDRAELLARVAMRIRRIPILNKYYLGFDQEDIDLDRFYDSSPSYPFINIDPKNVGTVSLPIVTTHELGHHYVSLYTYAKTGSRGADPAFVRETAPNWMAINVLPNEPVDNLVNRRHYNDIYLGNGVDVTPTEVMLGCDSMDRNTACDGYPSVALLQNYSELVADGKTKIMDATMSENALKYLYEQAGAEDFARVMTQLAERNLTGDYGGKLVNYTLPKGESLNCADVCSMSYTINPAATGYVYFAPEEYRDTVISFKSGGNVTASVVGKTLAGTWTVLASGEAEIEFEVTEEILNSYELLAFAVSNSDIAETGNYVVEVVKAGLEDLIVEDGEFDFGLGDSEILTKVGEGCYLVNTDKAFEYLNQLMGLGSELLGALSSLDETGSFSEVKTQYDQDAATAQANLDEAKAELSPYRVTICANYIKSGLSFDMVKAQLRSAMGQNLNLYNGVDGSSRVSVFVGFDILARRAKAYALVAEGGEMGLFTIGLEEK